MPPVLPCQLGWAAKKSSSFLRVIRLLNIARPRPSTRSMKTYLAISRPIMITSDTDASLKWCSTPPLWHIDAVGGRPPHHQSARRFPRSGETRTSSERAAPARHVFPKGEVRRCGPSPPDRPNLKPWKPGQSGNSNGRPVGSRQCSTRPRSNPQPSSLPVRGYYRTTCG
jgi:hypothetical protein